MLRVTEMYDQMNFSGGLILQLAEASLIDGIFPPPKSTHRWEPSKYAEKLVCIIFYMLFLNYLAFHDHTRGS